MVIWELLQKINIMAGKIGQCVSTDHLGIQGQAKEVRIAIRSRLLKQREGLSKKELKKLLYSKACLDLKAHFFS